VGRNPSPSTALVSPVMCLVIPKVRGQAHTKMEYVRMCAYCILFLENKISLSYRCNTQLNDMLVVAVQYQGPSVNSVIICDVNIMTRLANYNAATYSID